MAFQTKEAAIAFAEKQGMEVADETDCRVGVLHSGAAQQTVQAQGVCHKLQLFTIQVEGHHHKVDRIELLSMRIPTSITSKHNIQHNIQA